MRTARIKASTAERDSVYHCMTRTVNGAFLFDDPAKEILRKQLWQIADYCGVQILTFAILSNHFHVLLRVPQAPIRDRLKTSWNGRYGAGGRLCSPGRGTVPSHQRHQIINAVIITWIGITLKHSY
jgi:hypothetical protein